VGSNRTGGMDVSCKCCVLSDRGLCGELIPRPEGHYRTWCVSVIVNPQKESVRGPLEAVAPWKKKTVFSELKMSAFYCGSHNSTPVLLATVSHSTE